MGYGDSSSLPRTGTELMVYVLIAVAVIAAGFALRRYAQ